MTQHQERPVLGSCGVGHLSPGRMSDTGRSGLAGEDFPHSHGVTRMGPPHLCQQED